MRGSESNFVLATAKDGRAEDREARAAGCADRADKDVRAAVQEEIRMEDPVANPAEVRGANQLEELRAAGLAEDLGVLPAEIALPAELAR